ncbi:hypothetical protein [Jiangella endophytica]|uniref:hypothetical protein n=1 Tax=Jiangella endophytica TaxID=1623398 RepID=UPI000E3555DD|nr:hypothetical protein [Jiangella endophytica]
MAVAALCAAGVVEDGPLAGLTTEVGQRSRDGGPVTISYVLPNDGSRAVTITHVGLLNSDGLTLEAAHVVPGRFPIGGPYPPETNDEHWADYALTWRQRVDAVGAVVPPGGGHDLVVGLRPGRPGASTIDGVEITYTEGGRIYRLESRMKVTICIGSRCSSDWPGDAR